MTQATEAAAAVLAKAACYDQTLSRPDANVLAAWAEALDGVPIERALDAVAAHYRSEHRRIMPADVATVARAAPALAQQGCAEPPDPEQVRARIAARDAEPSTRSAAVAMIERQVNDRSGEHLAGIYAERGWVRDEHASAAQRHACPWCGAAAHERCTRPSHAHPGRQPHRRAHPTRVALTVPCPGCGAGEGQVCADRTCEVRYQAGFTHSAVSIGHENDGR